MLSDVQRGNLYREIRECASNPENAREMISACIEDAFDHPWPERRFHKLVLINGDPIIGEGTRIGIFSEVYDHGGIVKIGTDCDIASFVAINCADSHARTIGHGEAVERSPIEIGNNVFIGSHVFIGGGSDIGHHSVVAAGTVLIGSIVPPYSLVFGAHPCKIRKGYYALESGLAPVAEAKDP